MEEFDAENESDEQSANIIELNDELSDNLIKDNYNSVKSSYPKKSCLKDFFFCYFSLL